MRVAVTGTHGVGKSTLIADFVEARGSFEAVAEPYWLLAQDGLPFADGPTTADLEEQLNFSCVLLLDRAVAADLIFDRCPLDFLAYLDVVSQREGFEWLPSGKLLGRIGKALANLDLIAFVPITRPDEIAAEIEHSALRAQVDRRLKAMLRDDDLGLIPDELRVVAISGDREARVARLMAAIDSPSRWARRSEG